MGVSRDKVENLPIYKDARALRLQILDSYEHFPKKYRYTLGNEMIVKSSMFFDYVVDGCVNFNKHKKYAAFNDAQSMLYKLETVILLATIKQCIGDEHAGKYIVTIPLIRKQISGLLYSLSSQNGVFKDRSVNL